MTPVPSSESSIFCWWAILSLSVAGLLAARSGQPANNVAQAAKARPEKIAANRAGRVPVERLINENMIIAFKK